MLHERRLVQKRAFPSHAEEEALLDEIEDGLSNRSDRDPEACREVALGRQSLARADLTPLDHLDQHVPELVVQRDRRVAHQGSRSSGCSRHAATL